MTELKRFLARVVATALITLMTFPLMAEESNSATQSESDNDDRVTVLEQDDANESSGVLEEVITTGTRSNRPRTAADSTVPIDVLSGDEFDAFGGTNDLTDNLKALVPSYTA
ncbi:MAG: hypothetical protein HKN15_04575, partial [Xanthomonadales bacterium]|nr:hypothetical protein [Xanthomonadales bacterium]